LIPQKSAALQEGTSLFGLAIGPIASHIRPDGIRQPAGRLFYRWFGRAFRAPELFRLKAFRKIERVVSAFLRPVRSQFFNRPGLWKESLRPYGGSGGPAVPAATTRTK